MGNTLNTLKNTIRTSVPAHAVRRLTLATMLIFGGAAATTTNAAYAADNTNTEVTVNDPVVQKVARAINANYQNIASTHSLMLNEMGFTTDEQTEILNEIIKDSDGFMNKLRPLLNGVNATLIHNIIKEDAETLLDAINKGGEAFVHDFQTQHLGNQTTFWAIIKDHQKHGSSTYGNTGQTPDQLFATMVKMDDRLPAGTTLDNIEGLIAKAKAALAAGQECQEIVMLSALIEYGKTFRDYAHGKDVEFYGAKYKLNNKAEQDQLITRSLVSLFDSAQAKFGRVASIDNLVKSLSTGGVLNQKLGLGDIAFTKEAATIVVAGFAAEYGPYAGVLLLKYANDPAKLAKNVNEIDGQDCLDIESKIRKLSGVGTLPSGLQHTLTHFKPNAGAEKHLAGFSLEQIEQVANIIYIVENNTLQVIDRRDVNQPILTSIYGHSGFFHRNMVSTGGLSTYSSQNRAVVQTTGYDRFSFGGEVNFYDTRGRIAAGKRASLVQFKARAGFALQEWETFIPSSSINTGSDVSGEDNFTGGDPANDDGNPPDGSDIFDGFLGEDNGDASQDQTAGFRNFDDIAGILGGETTTTHMLSAKLGSTLSLYAVDLSADFTFLLPGVWATDYNSTAKNFTPQGRTILDLGVGLDLYHIPFKIGNRFFETGLYAKYVYSISDLGNRAGTSIDETDPLYKIAVEPFPDTQTIEEARRAYARGEYSSVVTQNNTKKFTLVASLSHQSLQLELTGGIVKANPYEENYLGIPDDPDIGLPPTVSNPINNYQNNEFNFFGGVTLRWKFNKSIRVERTTTAKSQTVYAFNQPIHNVYVENVRGVRADYFRPEVDWAISSLWRKEKSVLDTDRKLNERVVEESTTYGDNNSSNVDELEKFRQRFRDQMNRDFQSLEDTTMKATTPVVIPANNNVRKTGTSAAYNYIPSQSTNADSLRNQYNTTVPVTTIAVDTVKTVQPVQTQQQEQRQLTPAQQRIIDNAIKNSSQINLNQNDSTGVLQNVFTPVNGSQNPANGNDDKTVRPVKIVPAVKPKKTAAQILKELNIDN